MLIGNFDYEGLVEVVEEGFLASDRLEENIAFYGPNSHYYGNGENTLDIHAMYSVMGNAHIYYAVSSPYLSPLMSYLMIYLLPHPTAPPPFLSSSYGYSGEFLELESSSIFIPSVTICSFLRHLDSVSIAVHNISRPLRLLSCAHRAARHAVRPRAKARRQHRPRRGRRQPLRMVELPAQT